MAALAKKRKTERDDPARRCIVTGESAPKNGLIRFVLGPGGDIVPDLAERLPGRGFWVSSQRDAIAEAVAKGRFARAARGPVGVPDDLVAMVERLLVKRCQDLIGLARRSDRLVLGYDRVLEAMAERDCGIVVVASDAGGARRDIEMAAADLTVCRAMTNYELSAATDKGTVSFAAVLRGGLADSLRREGDRLQGFRPAVPSADETDVNT